MRILTKEQFKVMDEWIQIYARQYDRAKWNCIFHNGSKDSIVSEMLKYQNPDGGFGNGFEADILLPLSAAIPTAEAIFQSYDYDLDCNSAWFRSILSYFENNVRDIPKYWEDCPPEIMNYPHAPWWNYAPCLVFNPNPCAVVSSALICYGTDEQKKLGYRIAQDCFELLASTDFCGEHDSLNIQKLIEQLTKINSPLVTDEIIEAMKHRIDENICYDTSKWSAYYFQPLDFTDSPSSMWYNHINKDVIEKNIEFWLDNINEQGVWEPNFSWGIDSDVSRQVTQNWRGYITVKRAKILLNFGRIEY